MVKVIDVTSDRLAIGESSYSFHLNVFGGIEKCLDSNVLPDVQGGSKISRLEDILAYEFDVIFDK